MSMIPGNIQESSKLWPAFCPLSVLESNSSWPATNITGAFTEHAQLISSNIT